MNYKKYLLTKFARFLLRQGITSVNVTKECFAFVPIQDFTINGDINWSGTIPEIDQQLGSVSKSVSGQAPSDSSDMQI